MSALYSILICLLLLTGCVARPDHLNVKATTNSANEYDGAEGGMTWDF